LWITDEPITDIEILYRSSGWTGPGAGTAPQNSEDNANFALIKEQVKAEEKERRDAENAERVNRGEKPCECPVMIA